MKKLVGLLLAVVMVFGLTACGGNEAANTAVNNGAGETAAVEESETKEGYKIAYCDVSMNATWRTQMRAEFEQRAEELKAEGVISEYYVTNANDDAAKQISDVKDMIAKGVDGILIAAVSETALSPVVEEAMEAGIDVISFNMLVDTDNVSGKVFQSDQEFGRIGAQFLVDKLDGKGDIIVLNGTAGNGCNENRWAGAEEVFNQYPDINIVGTAYADWEYAKGKAATESLLSANAKIDGVWSQGGAMTQGAIDAFIAADRPLVPMSGEAGNGFLRSWKENTGVDAFDSVAPIYKATMILDALDSLLTVLDGGEIEAVNELEMGYVTEDTIDEYFREDMPDSYWVGSELSDENLKNLFE